MSSSEFQLYREFAQAAPSVGPEARAAAAALVASGAAQVADWSALFAQAAELARWEEALEIARHAARGHPESAAAALLVPTALAELKRLDEAHRAFEAVGAAFPDDFEALDRLTSITWHLGYLPGALAHVEEALARGLRGRDHIVQMGTSSATMMGLFERARQLCGYFADAQLGRNTLEKIRIAEEEWSAAAVQLNDQYGGEISVGSIERMLADERYELTRHAAVRLVKSTDSAPDLEFLIHRMHPLGPPGWFLSQWAGQRGVRDFPDYSGFKWGDAGLLLQRGAFGDAGRLLLTLVDSDVYPDFLLRWMVFAAAGGGLSAEQLLDAASRVAARGSRDGAYRLVLSFLKERRAPGTLDLPRASRQEDEESAPLSVGAPGHQLRRFYLAPRMRRPRVAVCVAGQLRSYLQTWPRSRAALAEWDTTVFVSTWRDTGSAFGAHDMLNRLLPGQVLQRLPQSLQRRSVLEARLPRVFSAITQPASVTDDELIDVFGTPFVRVREESRFERDHCEGRPGLEHRGKFNQAKMFFTIADANAMKADFEMKHGFIFDAVLRLRPDCELTRLGALDVQRVMEERTILTGYLHQAGLGDQVLLSSSEVADIYGDIWPRLEACGSPAYLPGGSGEFAEELLAEHVIAHGVEVGLFASTWAHWPSAAPPPWRALWTALLDELNAPARHDVETRALLTAFCEAMAEHAEADPGDYARPGSETFQRWELLDGLSDRARRFVEGG